MPYPQNTPNSADTGLSQNISPNPPDQSQDQNQNNTPSPSTPNTTVNVQAQQNPNNLAPIISTNVVPNPIPEKQVPNQGSNQANKQNNKPDYGSAFHSVFEALAGGPRVTYKVNPQTGTLEKQTQTLTRGKISAGILAGAITGMLAGAGERGPGAAGRALAKGGEAGASIPLAQQQQSQQQSKEDFARSASIAETNFRMYQNALTLGKLDYDQHKQYVDDYSDVLNQVEQTNAYKAQHVSESDLNKYHVTRDLVIPDGVVARMDAKDPTKQAKNQYGQPLWDNTYTIVDPEAQINLPKNVQDLLVKNHVPGYSTKNPDGTYQAINLPDNVLSRAKLVLNGMSIASGIQTTEADINNQLKQFDPKSSPIDIAKSLDNDIVTPKALQTFQRYTSLPLDQAIEQMSKDKVDPNVIGQISSLINTSNPNALTQMKEKRELDLKKKEADVETQAQHQRDINKQKDENSPENQAAIKAKAKLEEQGKTEAREEAGNILAFKDDGTPDHESLPALVTQGNISTSQLSKRQEDLHKVFTEADKYTKNLYGLPYNAAQAQIDFNRANNQQNINILRDINSLTEQDGIYDKVANLSNKFNRTNYPALNDTVAWANLQSGNHEYAQLRQGLNDLADTVGRLYTGGGTPTDMKMKQAKDNFEPVNKDGTYGNFSDSVVRDLINTSKDLVNARRKGTIGDNRFFLQNYGPPLEPGFIRVKNPNGKIQDVPVNNAKTYSQRYPGTQFLYGGE